MKRFGLSPYIASATLFLGLTASDLHAQEKSITPAPSIAPTEEKNPVAEYMKRLDKDGDGALSDAERAAAKEILMKEPPPVPAGRGFPGAGPGREGPEQFKKRMIEMFDANKDGRLDDIERAAAEKFMAERGMGPGNMREQIIKRFDKNGNGRIDEDEQAAVEAFMRERMATARNFAPAKVEVNPNAEMEKVVRTAVEANTAQVRRFDANKDGKLDDTEWALARKEIQNWSGENAGAAKPAASTTKSVEEKKRLERTAEEVERRRKMREQAKQQK